MNGEFIAWYDYVNLGFAGAMSLVFLYAMSIYLYDSRKIYFYYALYIFSVGLYLFSRSEFVQLQLFTEVVSAFPKINYYLTYTFQYIAHFAALQFGILFLNAKIEYPKFYQAASYVRVFFFIAIILSILNISTANNQSFNYWLIDIERIIATLATIYFQIVILKFSKNKLVIFYIVGSILFLVGALVSVFALDVVYMRIGVFLEVLIFSLGLAYRSTLIQEERNLFREKMLEETSEKERLLQQYNSELKKQVLERSEALLKEQQLVEDEKQKVLRLSLEKEVDKVRITALRAQMKPHFLFNALNAIRSLIIKEDPYQAYDYLTDFSHLVRYILESSESSLVSLAEELRMIKIYIRIERIRVDDSFEFKLEVDESLNPDEIQVPPLIFQPFLENAIVHAFEADRKDQKLELKIKREKDILLIIVTDNGKGIDSGELTPNQNTFKKKSMAMDLTKQRLELLESEKTLYQVRNLREIDKSLSGTQVIIKLPILTNGEKAQGIISR